MANRLPRGGLKSFVTTSHTLTFDPGHTKYIPQRLEAAMAEDALMGQIDPLDLNAGGLSTLVNPLVTWEYLIAPTAAHPTVGYVQDQWDLIMSIFRTEQAGVLTATHLSAGSGGTPADVTANARLVVVDEVGGSPVTITVHLGFYIRNLF